MNKEFHDGLDWDGQLRELIQRVVENKEPIKNKYEAGEKENKK